MTQAKNRTDLARKAGMSYQRISRAIERGWIKSDARGRFAVEHCRTLILNHAAMVRAGTPSPEKRALIKVRIRKMRAEADILENKVKSQSDGEKMLPMLLVRKAWRACESLWVQQLRTIARQLGANWGGKLGKEIEALAVKLHA
ncbi:MAG: hypothetical protein E8D47_13210, partial [Nitrospira sp.]